MKKIIISVVVMIFSVVPTLSMATLIQEIWTGTIVELSQDAKHFFSIGDTHSITVRYNDEGHIYNEWNDGINLRAEFGSGDDEWIRNYTKSWSNYSTDAIFEFGETTGDFLGSYPDTTNTNIAYAYEQTFSFPGHSRSRIMKADGIVLTSQDFYYSEHENAIGYRFSTATNLDLSELRVGDVDIARSEYAPVPEPATIILLGMGLAGLAGYRKRHQAKNK